MKMPCLSRDKIKLRLWVFLSIFCTQAIFLCIDFWWISYQDGFQNKLRLHGLVNERNHFSPREKSIQLFVAILTHSMRRERRDAIRETWMLHCNENPEKINCRFFSDEVGLDDKAKQALDYEKKTHNDIVVLNATEHFAFAERLLLIWEWSRKQHINYEYFLRIDDDHFLCVDRVLHELRHRPKDAALYWGFVHCQPRVVRVDEAWLMLSSSIVDEIMSKRDNQSLLCFPYGDQAVAMWVNDCKQNVTFFMDNARIVHKSAGENPAFFRTDVCETFLSLHGAYPRAMRQFWLLSQILRKKSKEIIHYTIPPIANFSEVCPFSRIFEYEGFLPEHRFEPKLCHLQPKWSISKTRHGGREEHGERYTSY